MEDSETGEHVMWCTIIVTHACVLTRLIHDGIKVDTGALAQGRRRYRASQFCLRETAYVWPSRRLNRTGDD